METVYDVRQLLKRFGIFIYIGERLADLALMEIEIKELYQAEFITTKQYQLAMIILKREKNIVNKDRSSIE